MNGPWQNISLREIFVFLVLLNGAVACQKEGSKQPSGFDYFDGSPEPLSPECNSVRLTSYEAQESGWCEFQTNHAFLPEFVRKGLHTAIAEPWNGGSYEGDPGEACGECWEVNTLYGTQVVMVTNLCPIQGNPLCSGGHFHFDLSTQAAAALGGGGLDEGTARRVPCPVKGDIQLQVNDANEWGYLRMAFMNHLIPIRSVKVRAHPVGEWVAAERSGGAWHVLKGPTPADGDGILFQLTSAEGESIESTNPLGFFPAVRSTHALGVQFSERYEDTGSCAFTPPAEVYDEGYGGIEGVEWQPNPWGERTRVSETSTGCFQGSSSCILVEDMGQWEGVHFYYRQSFPVTTFDGLRMQLKALSKSGNITAAASLDGARCQNSQTTITHDEWTEIDIKLSTSCSSLNRLNAVTIVNTGPSLSFIVDKVEFYHL